MDDKDERNWVRESLGECEGRGTVRRRLHALERERETFSAREEVCESVGTEKVQKVE